MRFLLIGLMFGACVIQVHAKDFYYGEPTVLDGKLVEILIPNDELGDKVIYQAVKLSKKMTVLQNNDLKKRNEFDQKEVVDTVQLAFTNQKLLQKFNKDKNKSASVSCDELFHAHTIHHRKEVVCMVRSVNLVH